MTAMTLMRGLVRTTASLLLLLAGDGYAAIQDPEFERREGTNQFHGGPIASFIDTVGDYALVIGLGAGVPTINYRVDYLRPAFGPLLTGDHRRFLICG